MDKSLYIPIILGTPRKERMSRHVADFVLKELEKFGGVETELIDVCELDLPNEDAGETIKHPQFSAQMNRAEAIVIVTPEYNHGYPGMLRHALDTNLKVFAEDGKLLHESHTGRLDKFF
jgi:NAD(P)H-dependent FMN reductase